jgi:hypothetical protein
MSATLEALENLLLDIQSSVSRILNGLSVSGNQVIVVGGLSDISQDLGLIKAGEFRAGKGTPGRGFTGVRIGSPGWSYDTDKTYSITGINNDVMQFGLCNEDGAIYAGAGAVKLDVDGFQIIGEGSTDINKRIKFRYNSSGTLYTMMEFLSDYGAPGGNMTAYFIARRPLSAPWSDTTLSLRVIDSNPSGKDVTLNVSSLGGVSVGGGTHFQVGDNMATNLMKGLAVGVADDTVAQGSIRYAGDLIATRDGATHNYTVYGFHPLGANAENPILTSTSWDGDARSTTAKTLIDLGTVFGVPDGVKAVLVRVALQDSGAASSDAYLILGPTNVANVGTPFEAFPANDRWNRTSGIVTCDADGNIYYQTLATGVDTLDVNLQIAGYWI